MKVKGVENTGMPSTIFSSKGEARIWGLRMREAMPLDQLDTVSARCIGRLLAMPEFAHAATLLTYVGSKPGELQTRALIERSIGLGKSVLVPITRARGIMEWSRLARYEDLVMSSRGILEPRPDAVALADPTHGLCVVPGLCFHENGHRIGFGGGYYDRFLATFVGTSIALAPEALCHVAFPVEPHDQPVSLIITENGCYATGSPTSE